MTMPLTYGARVRGNEAEFRVWAPRAQQVTVRVIGRGDFPMHRDGEGVFTAALPARAGERYAYMLDGGKPLPDPVSRLLPEGVHGPTEIVDAEAFRWTDGEWRGVDFRDYVIYELHVGTFTPQGTFDGVIEKLDYLKALGVTVIEIMPVAAFPGTRNWGYDGVSLYAVQASYGGPDGLKRLVDAAHGAGLAVTMDVVYNHLGNEGNYLGQFGPYFTDKHHTPWGDAINYDQPGCEEVRRYFVENALYWVREYHIDALRLDAIQTIKDDSPRHIVAEIAEAVHTQGVRASTQAKPAWVGHPGSSPARKVYVIAETDENERRYVLPKEQGGFGVDAVWSDDFHHALHTLLTDEREGYYQDFGKRELLARALNEGFAFQGEAFKFWDGRPRGTPAKDIPLYRHVICTQNHDQVGNRAKGERLTALVPRGARKLAAALLLLAPQTPLLFMGQEYDEEHPFQFFTDYGDPALQKAVSEGRRREFQQFSWEEVPEPQAVETFEKSKLNWEVVGRRSTVVGNEVDGRRSMVDGRDGHVGMWNWFRSLMEIRRRLVVAGERTCKAEWRDGVLVMQVPARDPRVLVQAAWPGSEMAESPAGWKQVMRSDEDGYGVGIYEKAVGH